MRARTDYSEFRVIVTSGSCRAALGLDGRGARPHNKLFYTPTGKGLVWASEPTESPANRPCSNDISPVTQ
jgi:hypothetical protein